MGIRETLTKERGPWPDALPTRHPVRTFFVGLACGMVFAVFLSTFFDLRPRYVLPLALFTLVLFGIDVIRERRAH